MSSDWLKGFAAVAVIIIVWLLFDRWRKSTEISRLKIEIQDNKYITEDIKRRLMDLVSKNKDLDPDLSDELMKISALIEIKQETKAIAGLAKVIENLLKRLYDDDPEFKIRMAQSNRSKPTFTDYIDFAKEKKVISPEDYHLVSLLRMIRNEESHELNVKKEHSRIIASFIAGITFILTLTNLLKQRFGSARPSAS
jgi:hypothetical protein